MGRFYVRFRLGPLRYAAPPGKGSAARRALRRARKARARRRIAASAQQHAGNPWRQPTAGLAVSTAITNWQGHRQQRQKDGAR